MVFQESFNEVLFLDSVVAYNSSQLLEQKESLFRLLMFLMYLDSKHLYFHIEIDDYNDFCHECRLSKKKV